MKSEALDLGRFLRYQASPFGMPSGHFKKWRIYSLDNELIRFGRMFLRSKNFSLILDNSVADSFEKFSNSLILDI